MDILKIFKKKSTHLKIKNKLLKLSKKDNSFAKAEAYVNAHCTLEPKKAIGYKKILFSVYKDIELEATLRIGDEIVNDVNDTSFTKVLAVRHKRIGNVRRHNALLGIKESEVKENLKIERNKIAKVLSTCTTQAQLESKIEDILECDEKEKVVRYKIIFSVLKDSYPPIAVEYGKLYFTHNPYDINFSTILLKRVTRLNLLDDINLIQKNHDMHRYLNKLKKGTLFTSQSLDMIKAKRQLNYIIHKLPSDFIEQYILHMLKSYPSQKVNIYKLAMGNLKSEHKGLALHFGRLYMTDNKHDLKFAKVLKNLEKSHTQELQDKEYISKLKSSSLFLSKKLNIKMYSKQLSGFDTKYSDALLHKVIQEYLTKFDAQRDQILRTTFSTLKDMRPECAFSYGKKYIDNNLENVKFAKVLLRRMQLYGENENIDAIVIAKKIYAKTKDEDIEYILVVDAIDTCLQKCEDLYAKNQTSKITQEIQRLKKKHPHHEALLYRKLLGFYAKKEYKKAEEYALKSLGIHHNEYVIKELYDLHITHGYISRALSVIPEQITLEALKIKKANGSSLLSLYNNGFDLKVQKISGYTQKDKKVFYLLHNRLPYNSGGYATRSHGLLTGVSTFGWEMHGVSRLGYPWDKMQKMESRETDVVDNIMYHRLLNDEIGLGKLPLGEYLEAYAKSLLDLAQKEQPSMIHSASNYMNGIVGNYVAKCLGIPSVYEVRGLWEITRISREPKWKDSEYYNLMAKMEADAAKGANIVFTLTEALRDEMVSRGVERNKIHLLPNGVVSERFSPLVKNATLATSLGLAEKTIVGFIGSFAQYEGLEYIVDAIEILVKKGRKDIVALMVGDGAISSEIQARVSEKNLEKYFVFTGRIPHDEVEEYYSLVDIAPLPRKGLPVCEMVSPLKPFEAMAMEKVVLSSNVAALAEIVKDNYNGMLFEKDNVDDLAQKIEFLADNPKLREKLGKQARQWVLENRDWKTISKNLHIAYEKLSR